MRPSPSVFSFTPRPSNQSTVSFAWNRCIGPISSRSPRGYLVQNSRGSKQACVTLHRPPPEIRTLARSCGPFSKTITSFCGAISAHVIAAKIPAAPPPTTTTRSLFERGIDAMDVLVIVERVQKISDLLFRGRRHCDRILGNVPNFRRENRPSSGLQGLKNRIKVPYLGDEPDCLRSLCCIFVVHCFEILRPGFNGVRFCIAVGIRMRGLDYAQMIEEEGNAARLSERTGAKQMSNLRRGAVAIVGETLDDHGNFVRRKSFVGDKFKTYLFISQAGALFDRPFNGISRDRTFAGLLHRRSQPRVQVRVSSAQFGRHHNFADELNDHLAAFLRVRLAPCLLPLCTHIAGIWKTPSALA